MDDEYSFEAHIRGMMLEDIEYCLLLFLRDGATKPPKTKEGDQEIMGFLREMVREARTIADEIEFKVTFTEECMERGLSLEEASAEYEKYLDESEDRGDDQ